MWAPKPEAGELTSAQSAALAEVTTALEAPAEQRDPLLLHGVTGSGKTEVYLRAAEEALDRGRSAIVLVPEIALTPQTAGRFVQRFGDRVAVLHSALDRARALRRVGPPAQRRRPRLRRAPLGRVRPGGGPGPDRGRRGARPVLQAGGRPALRRALGGRAPRRAGGRAAAGGDRHPPARGLARAAPGEPARAGGRPRAAAGGGRLLAGGVGCPARTDPRGPGGGPPPRGEGDRAAQPARVVELPQLSHLRALVGLPGVRRDPGAPPVRRPRLVPPLRAQRAGAGRLPGLRLGVDRPPRRGHRAARSRAGGPGAPAARRAPGHRQRRRRRASARCWSASSASPRRCWWAPRWWPRATTSRT